MNETLLRTTVMSTWLTMPWRTSHASMRWLMLALMAGALAMAVWLEIHADHPGVWRVNVLMVGASVACAWAFWLSAGVLTAIDARGLRLPGAERTVVNSLLLWGALTAGVPALILGAFGGNTVQAVLWFSVATCTGLAFALLPRWCAVLMGFLPMLVTGLRAHGLLPPPHTLATPANGGLALVALLAAITWRWHVLLRTQGGKKLGFGSAVVLQYRRAGIRGGLTGPSSLDEQQWIRQRPDWLQPRPALHNAGPATPVLALRVALGGLYLPKTLVSRLRAWGFMALILLSVSALLVFEGNDDAHVAIWHAIGPGIAAAVVFFGVLGLAVGAGGLVRSRWQRVNAELPLLALLPGLGSPAAQQRTLLRAIFGIPVSGLLLLLAGTLIASRFLPLHGLGLLLVALVPLAIIANLVASTLCTLGDRRLPVWGEWLQYGALTALTLASTLVPCTTLGDPPSDAIDRLEQGALAGWVALTPVIAWLVLRGWRAFITRPHPFLPTVD